jgi:hypothetical protein
MRMKESDIRRIIRQELTEGPVGPAVDAAAAVAAYVPPKRRRAEKLPDVLEPIDDVDNPDVPKGGPWGIPGVAQTAASFRKRFGKPGLYNADGGKVKPWESEKIAQRVAVTEPDEIIAYSRGAATYNYTKATQPGALDGIPVTYVAPSSFRRWTNPNAPVTPAPAGSKVLIGDGDKIVPYKQACKNAVAAGAPMYVLPGFSHTGIMYSKGEITPGAFEVDAEGCVNDPEMPDWKNASSAPPEQFVKQGEQIKQHIKHEAAIRSLVRGILREV